MRRPPLEDLARHTFPWVSAPELAEHLQCDHRTILRMIEAGALDAYRVGRCWRIPTDDARRAFHVERTSRDIS